MKIIVAIDRKGAIGRGGDLLYHIGADLRRFKTLTIGHTVIMGRRTFESLPKGALPNRRNIVVTRQSAYSAPGIETAHSLEAALAMASDDSEAFVIGGAEIYRQALGLADELLLTVVDAETADADTFFPPIPLDDYRVAGVEVADTVPACRFITLVKRVFNNIC